MKYLVTYLKICHNHINHDCGGCPFNRVSISKDCHDWIIENPEKSAAIIKEYVQKIKSADKNGHPRTYALICKNCGTLEIYSERDFEWDGYIDSNVFVCQKCKNVQEAPNTVGVNEREVAV